ncbi:MAG: hypothetical protein NZ937_04310 [Armatimonadetes bacterium]|nr:hypothetical protein [Armatimonadota bacterium]
MRQEARKLVRTVTQILKRYEHYKQHLHYPGDWGERALRGWIVCEVFQDALGWSSASTVFGEQFDVVFVNGQLLPVIYMETKKPEVALTKIHRRQTLRRAKNYPTLRHVVLTNGWIWERWDGKNFTRFEPDAVLNFQQVLSVEDSYAFFEPMFAKHFRG